MKLYEALGIDPALLDPDNPPPEVGIDPKRAANFVLNEIPRWVDSGKLNVEAVRALLYLRPISNRRAWRLVMGAYFEEARRSS